MCDELIYLSNGSHEVISRFARRLLESFISVGLHIMLRLLKQKQRRKGNCAGLGKRT